MEKYLDRLQKPDEDGEYTPLPVLHNRQEAWAWDEEKRLRWKGKQKAPPTYKPTILECLYDTLTRYSYFGKDPLTYVKERLEARKFHALILAEHDEKHASFQNTNDVL